MKLRELARFKDPARLWQRLRLYSTRVSPTLRWQEAFGFESIWKVAQTRSLAAEESAHMLFGFARHASRLDGAMAEVGVFRGGTARLLAELAQREKRTLHLFDTFEGMPETNAKEDLHTAGDFADTSLESVQRFLASYERVHLYKGFFPATAEPVKDQRFSFVHVDVDIHDSVFACCEFFYPRLERGGILLFDDYAWKSCPGAKRAVDHFFADKREAVIHLITSQAIVVKL